MSGPILTTRLWAAMALHAKARQEEPFMMAS